jgi:hypothetical protein
MLARDDDPFVGLPRGRYGAIVADVPSRFKNYTALQTTNWNSRRDVERHYHTMSYREIAALPVPDLASPKGCHLFLWTSGPHMPQAIKTVTSWKFKYSTIVFTWIKLKRSIEPGQLRLTPLAESDLHFNLGLTTRKNSEKRSRSNPGT